MKINFPKEKREIMAFTKVGKERRETFTKVGKIGAFIKVGENRRGRRGVTLIFFIRDSKFFSTLYFHLFSRLFCHSLFLKGYIKEL